MQDPEFAFPAFRRISEGSVDGARPHLVALFRGVPEPTFAWTRRVNAAGGAMTWRIDLGRDGRLPEDTRHPLDALSRLLAQPVYQPPRHGAREMKGTGAADLRLPRRPQFFFESPGWVKHLAVFSLAGLLSCVLIGLPYLAGYLYRMAHRRANGQPPLPPLDDVFGMFKDGLRSLLFTELQMLVFFGPSLLFAAFGIVLGRPSDDFDPGLSAEVSPAVITAMLRVDGPGRLGLVAAVSTSRPRTRVSSSPDASPPDGTSAPTWPSSGGIWRTTA